MNRTFYITLLSLILSIGAQAESWPGYSFKVSSLKETKIEEKTVWMIQIASDDPLKDELRITFENETRKVTEVIWMTKGMYPLLTPSLGIYVPKKPTKESKALVILSVEKLKNADYSDIALVNFIWDQSKNEQDVGGNG